MINRKVLYFYEYASEIRGRCLGHARLMVCGHVLKITLAFSLPEWEKKNCKLYFASENSQGKTVVLELGEIMPCEIMTVYHLDVAEEKLDGICICNIINTCLIVRESENRYIKAVSGIFDITSKSLDMLLGKNKDENTLRECKEEVKEETLQECREEVKEETLWECGENVKKCVVPDCGDKVNHEKKSECEDREKTTDVKYGQKEEKLPRRIHTEATEQEVMSVREHIERLMATRPEYRPFGGGKITYSVRIGIGDVINLSEAEPGLKDNSFLLHGFYKYKHILLGGGMIRGRMNYYILVPGVKVEREQRIADMYGFHEFVSLDGQPAKMGGFGYYSWLLPS